MRRPRNISFTDHPSLFDDLDHMRPGEPVAGSGADDGLAPMAERPTRAACLRFVSFGSGSSGNCAYIGDDTQGLLIDAGVDFDRVEQGLANAGVRPQAVKGILVTHDHSDHIRHVYAYLRQWRHMALYCTPKVLGGMMRRHSMSRRVADYHKPIYKEYPFRAACFEVTAFDVSHDGTDNVGYHLRHLSEGGQAFAVATDLGCVTERVDHYMHLADHVMIEANYDLGMLLGGSYPEYLKRRIQAVNGHLDNMETARFVAQLAAAGRVGHIFLCHLSQDNNTPELALAAVRDALAAAGLPEPGDASGATGMRERPLQLLALPRYDSTPLFVL